MVNKANSDIVKKALDAAKSVETPKVIPPKVIETKVEVPTTIKLPDIPGSVLKESKPIEEKRIVKIVDLSTDFNASSARLIELKNNRHVDDIPLSDEYWKALKKHNSAYGVK